MKANKIVKAIAVEFNLVTVEIIENDKAIATDYIPETIFADTDRMTSLGYTILDGGIKVETKAAPVKKVAEKKVETKAKPKAVKKVKDKTKSVEIEETFIGAVKNIESAMGRVIINKNYPAIVKETQPEAVEVADTEEPVQAELFEKTQEMIDGDISLETYERIHAVKTKAQAIKMIEEFTGEKVSEYVYDNKAKTFTVELSSGKIIEAEDRSELLENAFYYASEK